jgi:hypothetical protein
VISDDDREMYGDLARGICAAWIADQQNLRSLDYVMRLHAPRDKPIGDLWIEIAKKVHEYAKNEVNKDIFGER